MLIIRDPNNPNYLPYWIRYFKNIDIDLYQKIYFKRRHIDRDKDIDIFDDKAFPDLKARSDSGELNRNDKSLIEKLIVYRGKDLNTKEKERVLKNSVKEIYITEDIKKEQATIRIETAFKALLYDLFQTDNFTECIRKLILEHISMFDLDDKVNIINQRIEKDKMKAIEYFENYVKALQK